MTAAMQSFSDYEASKVSTTKPDENTSNKDALQAEITRLSTLDAIGYELERDSIAKALRVRASFLDKQVESLRKPPDTDKQHDELTDDVIPWGSSVSGGELADSVKRLFDKHLVLPSGASTALSLWIMASYAIDSFRIFPKVLISSPEKRCGKTTTLEVIGAVAYRSLPASNVTASVLFRAIQAWNPTLLIDEADTFIHGKDELTGVINSGHTKSGAFVLRTQEIDGEWQPVKFSTWTPMVLAMIKKPPSTIIDRSLVIELQRKKPDQVTQRMPIDLADDCSDIRRKLARWAADHADALKAALPDVPKLSSDRAMDNWRPLLAAADLIGWSDRARTAMIKLSDAEDELSIEAELLIDIRALVDGKIKIFSADLVSGLIVDEDRPWCEWRHGKPMTQNTLSKLLSGYKIKSKDVRIGATTKRGYEVSDFESAFTRYIPNQSATTLQPAPHKGFGANQSTTLKNAVALPERLEPAPHKGCSTVALQNWVYREVTEL